MRLRLSVIYIYNVITPHRSVFLSLSLTLKCCLHSFFPVQRRYSSSWQTRFFGNQPQRTACCSCIYYQRARNTICEYNGNPLVRRSLEGNMGTAVLYTFGSYVIFIPPPPNAKPSRYYVKKLTLIMFCNMMVILRFALILPSGLDTWGLH